MTLGKLEVWKAGADAMFEYVTLYDGMLEYEIQFDHGKFNGKIIALHQARDEEDDDIYYSEHLIEADDWRYNQLLATALCVQNREERLR